MKGLFESSMILKTLHVATLFFFFLQASYVLDFAGDVGAPKPYTLNLLCSFRVHVLLQ